MNRIIRYTRYTLGLFVMLLAPSANAETINCTPVTALPAVISTQGVFCFTGHLATSSTSGDAITITVNNVTLDLNGFKLGGLAAGTATTAIGIGSNADNVTVKNGIVRGFATGIDLQGRGATIEDLLVDQNTKFGISGLGPRANVRGNQVVDTGGSTDGINQGATGILGGGAGSIVQGNLVSGLQSTGSGTETGILMSGVDSLAVNNFVNDTAKPTAPGAASFGFNITALRVNIVGNAVSNLQTCIDYGTTGSGIIASNTVTGCDTNFSGTGIAVGQQGNNFIP